MGGMGNDATTGAGQGRHTLDEARRVLVERFGHEGFRQGQTHVIREILAGNDVLAVMPTGAGKSVCYEVPATLMGGMTIVVSPLISLMDDQVRALVGMGIRGSYLNSTLSARQQQIVLERARDGWYDLMYVAPERLADDRFREFASAVDVPLIAVDEAHCVSQWGMDFRPSYQRIAPLAAAMPRRPTMLALTATATPRVREDITKLLGLRTPFEHVEGFDRPNLAFYRHELSPPARERWIGTYVADHRDASGIIYATTRKRVNTVCAMLRDAGIDAVSYHAGMGDGERADNQRRFVTNASPVMVATTAFGMGIDKPDVRYVVNDGLPLSIESYYQEAGRAGRDGAPAECHLLWSRGDIRTCHFFIEHGEYPEDVSRAERRRLMEKHDERLGAMIAYAMGNTCLRYTILTYFGEDPDSVPKRCDACSVCLDESMRHARGGHVAPDDGGDFAARVGSDLEVGYVLPVRVGDGDDVADEALFQRLLKLRDGLAEMAGVPAEAVFANRTLRAMVSGRPRTQEELACCVGASWGRAHRYGDAFLEMLQDDDGSRAEMLSASEVTNDADVICPREGAA